MSSPDQCAPARESRDDLDRQQHVTGAVYVRREASAFEIMASVSEAISRGCVVEIV